MRAKLRDKDAIKLNHCLSSIGRAHVFNHVVVGSTPVDDKAMSLLYLWTALL